MTEEEKLAIGRRKIQRCALRLKRHGVTVAESKRTPGLYNINVDSRWLHLDTDAAYAACLFLLKLVEGRLLDKEHRHRPHHDG